MGTPSRRVATAVACLALLIGIAACGGSDTEAPTGADTPNSAGNNRAASTSTLTSANFAPRLLAAQAKAGTAHLEGTIEAGQAGRIELSADLRLDSADPGAHMTMSTALLGQGIEAILLDKTMYVKVPGLSTQQPWLKMSLTSGPFAGTGLGAVDATSMLKGLQGALALKPQGQESIDGVATTHYQVTVDATKALAAQGLRDLASLGSSSGQSSKIAYDLWVDGDDLVRKIALATGSYSLQMTFSAYGEPVDITAPPASQIGKAPMIAG